MGDTVRTKKTVAEIVTERIIDRIKTAGDWVRPWQISNSLNWSTKREYTGINRWLLSGGEYMTFIQGSKLGYSLEKGAKSRMIVRVIVKKYPQGKNISRIAENITKHTGIVGNSPSDIITRAVAKGHLQQESDGSYSMLHNHLRYYNVFEIGCFRDKGGKQPESRFSNGDVEDVIIDSPENIINNYLSVEGILLTDSDVNRAYYDYTNDCINMPPKERFTSKTNISCYYSTLFHEIAHSTGNAKRLNRPYGQKGTDAYAFEELVAELTASMLCHETGVDSYNRENYDLQESNTTAYIAGWLRYFEKNTSAIIQAASLADKARDYVLKWANDNIIPDTFEDVGG